MKTKITAPQVQDYLPLDYIVHNTNCKVNVRDGWTKTVRSWIEEKGKVKITLKETAQLINSFVPKRIIIEHDALEAEEFCSWLISQGYDADVETAGRHSAGKTEVENYDGNPEELISRLWESYCKE